MRIAPFVAVALIPLLLSACGSEPAPEISLAPDARRIEADVRFLSDDLLEGREAGTRGYDIAAGYVAARFRALGLEPAGDAGSYVQTVPLLQGWIEREGARLELVRDGRIRAFAFQDEFLPGISYGQSEVAQAAPLVFVGQAVHAPEFGVDHFAGLDLDGKIAVMLGGAPAGLPADPRAFYSSGREKLRALAERGAVGVISLPDPARAERYPWPRMARNWDRPGMRLRDPAGQPIDEFPGLRASARMSLDAGRTLFEGAAMDFDAVIARAAEGTLSGFDLPGSVVLASRSRIEPIDSVNVVARLPGSDPALADQHVVYSAHLDHVGIGAEVDGDGIHNGALDNAIGVSILLEAARQATEVEQPARRSQVFIAVTAEEKGLLGAEHFAANPSVPGTMVANINIDMPILLWPQNDVVPIGIEHSSLKADVEAAANALAITLSPDPRPEEVVFIRSDQFAFIRQGVPAVYLKGGLAPAEGEHAGRAEEFLLSHYHQPSDQIDLPIDYPSAARMARLNAGIGQRVANADKAPRWNKDDFFGDRFADQ